MGYSSLVTGPNGSGKTTLLRVLADPMTGGNSSLLSQILPGFPAVTTTTTYLPQGSRKPIFSRYVRSLLTAPLVYGGASIKDASLRALALLGRFSFGHLIERDYFTLSGGEQQFVGLFSVLLWESDLTLLDDPLAMLDQDRREAAIEILNNYMLDKTTLIGCSSPELYNQLDVSSRIHLGYTPDEEACIEELRCLLRSLSLENSDPSVLELNSVTVAPFGRELLSRVSQHFSSGRLYSLAGPNGEGKSCLLQVLAGLRQPQSGSVGILTQSTRRTLSGVTALYMPQNSTGILGFGSIEENLLTSRSPLFWKRVVNFLHSRKIIDLQQPAGSGSYGEAKFACALSIIGASLSNPAVKLLLLDEPDTSLDNLRSHLLLEILNWLAQQERLIIIFSSHRLGLYLSRFELKHARFHLQNGFLRQGA
jgi:ABC-type multidrug transport system ATPase subunit